MNAKVYNIIWADDDIATLEKDEEIRSLFLDKGICLLKGVTTSERLRQALDMFKDKVDAVIIDANYSRDEVDYLQDDDISGLIHSATLVELYNVKREIPFFLYTARKGKLSNLCKNQELAYFSNNKRIFLKGEIKPLIDNLIQAVEHIQSIEFRVHKQYAETLDIAKNISPECSDLLWDFLLNEARDITLKRTELMFNDLRNILEKVVSLCREYEIIPDEVKTLNNFKHYWSNKLDKIEWIGPTQCPKTIKGVPIMPKAMSATLWNFIDILQDGSHSTEELRLFVREYVTDTKKPFLFRTAMYQTLDILRWIDKLMNDIDDGKIQTPLYKDKY